jgi:hypothetical protein
VGAAVLLGVVVEVRSMRIEGSELGGVGRRSARPIISNAMAHRRRVLG